MKLLILQNKKILLVCKHEFKFQYEAINTPKKTRHFLSFINLNSNMKTINTLLYIEVEITNLENVILSFLYKHINYI